MFRHLATLALALTLSTQAFADDFAAPPAESAPAVVDDQPPARAPVFRAIAPAVRATLRTVLAKRRTRNIAAFAAYAKAGVYPHNGDAPGLAYVWTDGDGHRCAAATMIWKSGARALVKQTAADHNDVRLAGVTEGPLLDWMLTSGLTIDEIDSIQQPFMRVETEAMTRHRVDAALAVKYTVVLTALHDARDASLEAAIDGLAGRPDLIAALIAVR